MNGCCIVCGLGQTDRAHIKSRGSGGTDEEYNTIYLCRAHHFEQHRIGVVTFAEKYPAVLSSIALKGWSIQKSFGRKKLVRCQKNST